MATRIRTAFLSSTGADLKAYREAAHGAINSLDDWKCVRMEDFGARDWAVDEFCREKVAECDLFIGIIGHRFGGCPPGSRQSYTQREYYAARYCDKPRLLFMAPDDFLVPANLREPQWKIKAQLEFRKALRTSGERLPAVDFKEPKDLALQITQAIFHWLAEPHPAEENPAAYLDALHTDTGHIDVRGFQLGQKEAYRFPIDELYTPLTTVLVPEEKQERKAAEPREQRAVPLQEALEHRRIVIVGDPGAGKTTFLRRIAFAACETLLGRNPKAAGQLLKLRECPFPVMISAASLAGFIERRRALKNAEYPADPDAPEWLLHYLEALSRDCGWGLSADLFRHKLGQEDGCLLLVDGLDEAPHRLARKSLARLLELAGRRFQQARIVLTSRPSGYGGETVIPGFTTVQIGPLEDQAIDTFLGNWCRLLYQDSRDSAEGHKRQLQGEIQSRPEIRAMAVNPVMLTALAIVHWNEKRLPDQRAELYEAVLRWLARRREERVGEVKAERCLGLMAQLAYAMHTGAAGKRVEIEPYVAALAIAPRFRELPEEEQIPAAEQFLADEEMHSGIVVRRGDNLKYWHQTFQEYMAAKAVAGLKESDRRRLLIEQERLYLPEWRETVLLLAGILHQQSVDRIDGLIEDMLDALRADASLRDRARCVGLIGAILEDLQAVKYRVDDPRYSENLERALAIFDREAARQVEFEVRLGAAEAIGQAGDPRLKADNWVCIEGGTFRMGAQDSDKSQPNFDPEAYEDEFPVRNLVTGPFLLGRYPVTVEGYAGFVDAGGYADKEYWPAGGYGRFTEPDGWRNQLRHPSRPVVSVSWYEAVAYCRWAGCRLPTEAEWEFAARNGAEGTRYPWGNDEADAGKASFARESGQPAPVGLYAAGATRTGVRDLAGNVWEWVADWYASYPDEAYANRTGPAEGTTKVLRGGSWNSDAEDLRSSDRDHVPPEARLIDVGFRCARDV